MKNGTFGSATTPPAPYTQAVEAVGQVIAAVRDHHAALTKEAAQPESKPQHTDSERPAGPVEEAVEQLGEAPGTMIEVIIDEVFSLLHQGVLYSGMGEEAVTAAFVASLTAANEIWQRLWLWPRDGVGERLLYQHYSDKEETELGADFSLIFVDTAETGLAYRVIVAQAKRLTAPGATTVNIWRKAFSQKKKEKKKEAGKEGVEVNPGAAPALVSQDSEDNGAWQKAATERLARALKDKPNKGDDHRYAENYQLTRLLHLRKAVEDQAGRAAFVYVVWPPKPKNEPATTTDGEADAAGPQNDEGYAAQAHDDGDDAAGAQHGEVKIVHVEHLEDVVKHFKANPPSMDADDTIKRYYPVSFPLEASKSFRDFLLDYKEIGSMSETELIAVLPAIRDASTATIFLNNSGVELSAEITAKIRLSTKSAYQPASRPAKTLAP